MFIERIQYLRIRILTYCNNMRCPFVQFQRPIGNRGQGHNDQERPVVLLDLHQVGDQGNSLDGFSETWKL